MPAISTVSVKDTIGLLKGRFTGFADDFASCMYAPWMGSVIFCDRVVGLDGSSLRCSVHFIDEPKICRPDHTSEEES